MEEEALPPPPSVDIGSLPPPPRYDMGGSESGTGAVDVTLKRKTVHTNVTVVESATRFWLSAQVMVACIMMGLLAVTIRSSRDSIAYFPQTFNSSCSNSTYAVKDGVELALTVMLDEAVNITNTQYQNSVHLARTIIGKSMNMSVDVFLLMLKQVNPLIYCTIDSGLAMAQTVKNTLRQLDNNIPTLSCNIQSVDFCKEATEALQDVAEKLTDTLDDWPSLPPSLTKALDSLLSSGNLQRYLDYLENFPAPEYVLTVNASQVIKDAMASATAFDDIATTCYEVSMKFESATHNTARVMYYIEIAIWVAIVALLVGIFIVAIIRQFPTLVVEWASGKVEYWTNRWETKIDNLEKNTSRTWKLYFIWTLKYINFKKAFLTTAYGIIGIILVYNLTSITNSATRPVEIWVNQSLGPGFDKIQDKLQEGINQVIAKVEEELNQIIREEIIETLVPTNGTLNEILNEKNKIMGTYDNISAQIFDLPVVGPSLANGIGCMLPLGALNIINTAINLMIDFLQDIMDAQLALPRFTFPRMSEVAVSATHIVVTSTVEVIQDQLKTYEIIFIILSCAFGVLVLQGLLFVALRRIAMRIKKQRRLSRMKSQQM